MKIFNFFLAITLLCLTYFVRFDLLLVVALCTTSLLALLTIVPSVRVMLIRGCALINMVFMFFYFFRFFIAVPMLDQRWYLQAEYIPMWVVLVGGFVSMHILADNSCCLKRELEQSAPLTLPRLWMNSHERHV